MPKHVFDKSWEPAETHYVEIIVLCLRTQRTATHPGRPEATQGGQRPPARETSDYVLNRKLRNMAFSVKSRYGIFAIACLIFTVPMVHAVIFLLGDVMMFHYEHVTA